MILNLGSYFNTLTMIDAFKEGFSDAEQRSARQEAKGGYDVSMKRLFAISLFTCFISVGFAYADGMYVSDRYTHLYEPSQKAVISWNGKRETMILSAAVKPEDLANFAWVIPIQSMSKPSVSAGDLKVFKDLVDYFKKPDSSKGKRIAPKSAIEGVQVSRFGKQKIWKNTNFSVVSAPRAKRAVNFHSFNR